MKCNRKRLKDLLPFSIQFLVFVEAAPRFVGCRLNKMKYIEMQPLLVDVKKEGVASLESWTYFEEVLEKDNRQIHKDEHNEDNSSMRFSKLEIMSGSYMPPFCLRTSLENLPRSLSRAAASIFITLKFQSNCCSQNRSNFFPSYFVFFMVFDDPFRLRWNQIIQFSTRVIFVVLVLLFISLVFFQKLLDTNSKVRDICCWVLFSYYVRVLFL